MTELLKRFSSVLEWDDQHGWRDIIQDIGESANGRPSDFGSEYPGSIPGSPVFREEPGQIDGVVAEPASPPYITNETQPLMEWP